MAGERDAGSELDLREAVNRFASWLTYTMRSNLGSWMEEVGGDRGEAFIDRAYTDFLLFFLHDYEIIIPEHEVEDLLQQFVDVAFQIMENDEIEYVQPRSTRFGNLVLVRNKETDEKMVVDEKEALELDPERYDVVSTHIYKIYEPRQPDFVKEITKIAKKAAKIGVEPPTVELVGEVDEPYREEPGAPEEIRHYFLYRVEGVTPKIEGWTFIAKIEPLPGMSPSGKPLYIVKTVPGEEVPVEYIESAEPSVCDYCKTERHRTATYLVRNDETGEIIQCGSTCIKDFTGGVSPEAVARGMQFERLLAKGDFAGDGGVRYATAWSLHDFLAVVKYLIEKNGWVSRSAARDTNRYATADDALTLLYSKNPTDKELVRKILRDSADDKEIDAAIEWARNLEDLKNDYLHNIHAIALSGVVVDKSAGLAASILPVYRREMGRVAERERGIPEKRNEWIGVKGGKIKNMIVTVTGYRQIEGYYGLTHLFTFEDGEGRLLKWFGSSFPAALEGVKDGEKVVIESARIKKLGEYKGRKETIIERPKFRKVGGIVPKLAKKVYNDLYRAGVVRLTYADDIKRDGIEGLMLYRKSLDEAIDDYEAGKFNPDGWDLESLFKSLRKAHKAFEDAIAKANDEVERAESA